MKWPNLNQQGHVNMRIMYVEDNSANISLLLRVARMGGHEVLNYHDGEVALERFAGDNPDLVLMDLQLAGSMGGLDVVRELRKRGVQTPIVAVTAYAMMGDRERCLEAGCDAYLSKPLPIAELVDMVQRFQDETDAKRAAPSAPSPAAVPAEPAAAPPTPEPAATPTVAAVTEAASQPESVVQAEAVAVAAPESQPAV